VVRPDIRGLGQSSADWDLDKGFGMDDLVSDLLAIVDHLGGGDTSTRVHVGGESMGGILGMAFAATHPQRVRTLTLVSSALYIGAVDKEKYALGYASQEEAQEKMGMQAWTAATNRIVRFPPTAEEGLMTWYEEEFAKNRADVQQAMLRSLKGFSIVPHLSRIQAPVLGLYPTGGPIVTPEHEQVLRTQIRNLHMVNLPSSFHKVQMVFPAACATSMLHFAAQYDGISCRES